MSVKKAKEERSRQRRELSPELKAARSVLASIREEQIKLEQQIERGKLIDVSIIEGERTRLNNKLNQALSNLKQTINRENNYNVSNKIIEEKEGRVI